MQKIELYMPSNGTEGFFFQCEFCDNCIKHKLNPDADNQCMILLTSYATGPGEDGPSQWRYVDGKPTCTAFSSREEHNRKRRESRKNDTQTLSLF